GLTRHTVLCSRRREIRSWARPIGPDGWHYATLKLITSVQLSTGSFKPAIWIGVFVCARPYFDSGTLGSTWWRGAPVWKRFWVWPATSYQTTGQGYRSLSARSRLREATSRHPNASWSKASVCMRSSEIRRALPLL